MEHRLSSSFRATAPHAGRCPDAGGRNNRIISRVDEPRTQLERTLDSKPLRELELHPRSSLTSPLGAETRQPAAEAQCPSRAHYTTPPHTRTLHSETSRTTLSKNSITTQPMQRPNKRTLHGSHSILALVFLSKRSSTTISYSLPTSCQASSSTINLIVDKLPVDSLLDDKFLFDAILGNILDVKLLDGDNFVPRRQIPRQTCSSTQPLSTASRWHRRRLLRQHCSRPENTSSFCRRLDISTPRDRLPLPLPVSKQSLN